MDGQGEFLHDHAFVELQVEGIPGEVDIQNLIRDTEEKLRLNACSCVTLRRTVLSVGECTGADGKIDSLVRICLP
ncbi:hypothetical protein DPX16_11395 [Anabarilius grahami]|uniref:Uncharacterized protein n=1 Tax=Anabarilius grahami TaxID=495550 RepID=A0A3N0Y419_ANAGA|nr:hypothetical protein DPX16_11395 [Anabarilius grahami]